MIRDLVLILLFLLSLSVVYEFGRLIGFSESADMYEVFLYD